MFFKGQTFPQQKRLRIYYIKKASSCIPDFIANAGGVIMAAMEYAKKIEKRGI